MISTEQFYNKLYKDNDDLSKYSVLAYHSYIDNNNNELVVADSLYDLHYNFDDVLNISNCASHGKLEDVYVSINSLYVFSNKRTKENLRSLNAFVLDYDYYKNPKYKNLSADEMYHNHIKETLLFKPTFVVDSGRGLYIIYTFKQANAKAMTGFYEKIWNELIQQQLKYDFGVDPQVCDSTRVIRLVGSYNSKSNSQVSVINYNDTDYVLRDFESILPLSKDEYYKEKLNLKKKQLERKTRNKTIYNKKTYKVNKKSIKRSKKMYDDFVILGQMNRSDNNTFRRKMLYLLYYQLLWEGNSNEESYQIVVSLNQRFNNPISIKDIKNHCVPSRVFKYPYSKETMINELSIKTLSKKEKMKLNYFTEYHIKYKKELNNRYRKNRNFLGRTKKQQEIWDRRQTIFKLLKENKTQKEITEILDLTKQTVSNDVIYIRENRAFFKEDYRPVSTDYTFNTEKKITTLDDKGCSFSVEFSSPPDE